jgi:hypothetical protein
MTRSPFQYDKPIFVRNPQGLLMNGKRYAKGDLVPWMERGLPKANIERLYNEHHLHHNEESEKIAKPTVGDGLDEMTVEQLSILVKTINEKVKAKTSSNSEYDRKRCRISKVKDKQAGLIRSWRRNYGDLEAE